MDSSEHRAIGDAASGGSCVNLGGESAEERFWLGYGDVMALSGDFFAADPPAEPDGADAGPTREAGADGNLFSLARVPGDRGRRPGTRDEIVCALRVMAADEAIVDARFAPGGRFADFRFDAGAPYGAVERTVRDRYLAQAATNDDHFLSPGGITSDVGPRPWGSAALAYGHLHRLALEEAWRLGRDRGDVSSAMAREAAAQHFLTDAFTAGHLRTPVAQIRRFWLARYPHFWESLQDRVASETAAALRELAWALRRLPAGFVSDSTRSALKTRTSRYPQLSLGDFLARLFHDWDNRHGLQIEGGGVVFGDGHVHEGITRDLAVAAVRAGIDDVEAAFTLGASGGRLTGDPLYRAVRATTGAPAHAFRAEAMIPRPSPSNPRQNWRATDVETLWDSPIVGATGTTVGEALTEMLRPEGQFIRQLDRLGQGLVEPQGLLSVPILGGWLRQKGARAYHRGFVAPLAGHPKRVILDVVRSGSGDPGPPAAPDRLLPGAGPAPVVAPARDDPRTMAGR
ncbi:MAG: hypothetical protein M3296_03485 [Actinomycetota bacterium]|nr:hypothetical protein [Actinomycetota bacterium]